MDYLYKRYNELLERWKNAEEYLDNTAIPMSERENNLPEAQKILRELSELLNEIGTYTESEALEGFRKEGKA